MQLPLEGITAVGQLLLVDRIEFFLKLSDGVELGVIGDGYLPPGGRLDSLHLAVPPHEAVGLALLKAPAHSRRKRLVESGLGLPDAVRQEAFAGHRGEWDRSQQCAHDDDEDEATETPHRTDTPFR